MLKFNCDFLPSGPILVFYLSIFRPSSSKEIDDTRVPTSQTRGHQNSEERWSSLRLYLKPESNSTTVSEGDTPVPKSQTKWPQNSEERWSSLRLYLKPESNSTTVSEGDTQVPKSQTQWPQNSEERWSSLRLYLKPESNSTTVSEGDTLVPKSQTKWPQNSEERWSSLRLYLKPENSSTTVSEKLRNTLVLTTEKSRPRPPKYSTTEPFPTVQTNIYRQWGDAAAVLRNKAFFESKTGLDLNDERMWDPGPIFTDDFFDNDTRSTSNLLYEDFDRMKRDVNSSNVSNDDDDMSWMLHQSKESEEMQKWVETSTLSASEEKLYNYYATQNFSLSPLNHSSIESISPIVYTESYENTTFTRSKGKTPTTKNPGTMRTFTYAWPTLPPSLSESQESWYAGFEERVKTTLSMDMFRPGDSTWWKSWSSTRKEDFTWTSYPPYHPHNATTARTNDWLPLYRFPSLEAWQNYTYHKLHANETHNVTKDHTPVDHHANNFSASTTPEPSQKRHYDSDDESAYEKQEYSFPNVHLTPSEGPWKQKSSKQTHSFWRGRGKPPRPVIRRTTKLQAIRNPHEEDYVNEETVEEDDHSLSEDTDKSTDDDTASEHPRNRKNKKDRRKSPKSSKKNRKDIKPRRKFDERRKGK